MKATVKYITSVLSFDWLLQLKTNTPDIWILFLPPVWLVWVFKIGQIAAKRRGISPWPMVLVSFIFPTAAFCGFALSDGYEGQMVLLIMSSAILMCAMAARYSIKYESEVLDTHPELLKYTFRFFQILYWMLGLWFFQPRLNDYFDAPREPSDR